MTNPALTALETALLAPVMNFLTALEQPGVNLQTASQQVGALSLNELLSVPGVESDILNLAASSVKAKLASVLPAPATPAASVAPVV